MKKLFCIFMILTFFSSYICVNADSGLYTCYPRVGVSSNPDINIIEFVFTLSDDMPDGDFLIALYTEGKLDQAYFCTVAEVKALIEYNLTVPEKRKKYISVEHGKTPDIIKVFALKDNIIPICEKMVFLENEEDILLANSVLSSQLEVALTELDALKKAYNTLDTAEKTLCPNVPRVTEILAIIGKDAISKKATQFLTKEFAQRYYYEYLSELNTIYNEKMSDDEKNKFKDLVFNYTDLESISYIIDYLGLKKYLM